jgi:3-oxoacyl-[acyl-carrier protein] reductase
VTLDDRVIVITGGSRGIGRACVLAAVDQGARVVFCSRTNGDDSRSVEAEAAARGGADAAVGVRVDVADEVAVASLLATARKRYGAVHGVVNNAAISLEGLLISMPSASWEEVIDVNLTGAFLVARAAVRVFLEQGHGGRIVSIGTLSQYGVVGNAGYAASKGGLLGLTRELAHQYGAFGINANLVVPGYVETQLSAGMSEDSRRTLVSGCPLNRAGTPEEIAAVVTFLLSASASGLNGAEIRATGGLMAVPS